MTQQLVDKIQMAKAPQGDGGGYRISIQDESGTVIGNLEAINLETVKDPSVAESLCRWRKMHMKFFLTSFDATPERTQTWLENTVLPDPTRALFFICDANSVRLGNFGICNTADDNIELDNMLRGEEGGARRLIHHSELALIHWIYQHLGLDSIYLRGILSGNERTVRHHERIGFFEIERIPLRKEPIEGGIQYVPCAPSDAVRHQINCTICKDEFYARHPWMKARAHDGTLTEKTPHA